MRTSTRARRKGRFQLPLSGSHHDDTHDSRPRDHYIAELSTPSLGITVTQTTTDLPRGRWAAFNSLSRDHFRIVDADLVLQPNSFNSLSRDHFTFSIDNIAARPYFAFNSLSRDHFHAAACQATPEAFNSLSRDHTTVALPEEVDKTLLSTPSLGITAFIDTPASIDYKLAFNSLSRDHRALFRDFPALRGFPPRRPFAHLYFSATI